MAKVMTVRPPEDLHNQMKRKAKEGGYTLNQLVLQILWNWLEGKQKK